jgi:hypothetical protein
MAHRRRQEEVREYHLPPPVIAEPPAFEPPESTITGTASIVYIPLIVEKVVEVERTVNVCPEVKPAPAKPRKRIVPAAPSTGGCH